MGFKAHACLFRIRGSFSSLPLCARVRKSFLVPQMTSACLLSAPRGRITGKMPALQINQPARCFYGERCEFPNSGIWEFARFLGAVELSLHPNPLQQGASESHKSFREGSGG